MAVIDDQTVLAHTAVRDLTALYDAYRASSRAHLLVLQRIGAAVDADGRVPEEKLETRAHLVRRAGLARETDVVFTIRAEQLRARLLELRGLRAAP